MSSKRKNSTQSHESYEDATSAIQMAELALIGFSIALILVCTAFYVCTRIMRHKHLKELRQMEEAERNPLGETQTMINTSNHTPNHTRT